MSNLKLFSVLVFCSFLGGAVFAADYLVDADESDIIYGSGVHAFFDRDYKEAVNILSRAEEIKNNDPRSYYFLGLAYLRQTKTEQADQYFKQAAQLEYSGRSLRDYAVSESLRRIQGEERLRIEKIRTEERTNARIRDQRIRDIRYGQENADAREKLLRSTQDYEKIPSIVQQSEDGFDDNAFGIKPIDPINSHNDNIIVRRAEINPFGGVEIINTKPEVAPTVQITPAPVRAERTFVNTDVATVQPEATRPAGNHAVPSMNIGVIGLQSIEATGASRLFGETLGTMFSKKAK